MSKIQDIHFVHRFASGRVINLSVYREPGKLPRIVSDCVAGMSQAEQQEYVIWRNNAVASLMSQLTPGEIFAASDHGRNIYRKKK